MANDSQVFDAQRIRHADVTYETSDLSHRAVFYFFIGLGVVIVLAYIVLWGMFKQLGGSEYAGHQTTNPIMTSNEELKEIGGDPANTFPMPHLQPDPIADLNKFRIREEQWMNTYGWVDHGQGKVHIPIEKAIDVMAASWPQQEEENTGTAQGAPGQAADPPASKMQAGKTPGDDRGGNYGW